MGRCECTLLLRFGEACSRTMSVRACQRYNVNTSGAKCQLATPFARRHAGATGVTQRCSPKRNTILYEITGLVYYLHCFLFHSELRTRKQKDVLTSDRARYFISLGLYPRLLWQPCPRCVMLYTLIYICTRTINVLCQRDMGMAVPILVSVGTALHFLET
jgi:hypothetical protein